MNVNNIQYQCQNGYIIDIERIILFDVLFFPKHIYDMDKQEFGNFCNRYYDKLRAKIEIINSEHDKDIIYVYNEDIFNLSKLISNYHNSKYRK